MSTEDILYKSRIIDSDTYSREITDLVRSGNGTGSFTFYEPPSKLIREDIIEAGNRFIINRGDLDTVSKIRSVDNFVRSIEEVNKSVSSFSTPESSQRLHFKSFLTEEITVISTGNFSASTMQPTPSSKLVRRLETAIEHISGGFLRDLTGDGSKKGLFGRLYYQANIAIVKNNARSPDVARDLTFLHNRLSQNETPDRSGNFLRADKAQDHLISNINRTTRGDNITIASPYIDSSVIANALSNASKRGVNVQVITSNTETNIELTTGSARQGIIDFVNTVRAGGGTVSRPTANDPLLYHIKAAAITGSVNVGYTGSSNFTNAASTNMSVDYMYVEEGLGSGLGEILNEHIKTYEMETLRGVNLDSHGITNKGLMPFYNEIFPETASYLIPSKYGASFFFGRAIYNSHKVMAGERPVDYLRADGFATAAYRFAHLSRNGVMPSELPSYIERYDMEMATPGLGAYINQYFLSKGFGRVYKDEVGALPSMAGMLGAVIDKSLSFYAFNYSTPDEELMYQSVDPLRGYYEKKPGLFESLFTFATAFTLSTTTATLLYFAVGYPYQLLSSELFKSVYQSILNEAVGQNQISNQIDHSNKAATLTSSPTFRTAAARSLTDIPSDLAKGVSINLVLGSKFSEGTPEEVRAKLIKEAIELGAPVPFDELGSVTGFQNIANRYKASLFFKESLDPFISDFFSPYSPASSTGKEFRSAFYDFAEQLATPIAREYLQEENFFQIRNVGFERAKSVAKSLDHLMSFIPANPLMWSMGMDRFTNPNPKDITVISKVFSFNSLVESLERIIKGDLFNEAQVMSYQQPTGGPLEIMKTKLQNFGRFSKALLQSRLNEVSHAYNNLYKSGSLKRYNQMRKFQIDLIKKNILYWDTESSKISFNAELVSRPENKKAVTEFMEATVQYSESLGDTTNILKIVRNANNTFASSRFPVSKIDASGRRTIIKEPFNKSNFFIGLLTLVNASFIFDDLAQSTTGASLISQLTLSLRAEETGGGGAFITTNRIFPTYGAGAYAASIGYTAMAIGAGAFIGRLSPGIINETYNLNTAKLIESLTDAPSTDPVVKLINSFSQEAKLGILLPSKNRFRNALITTGVILAARPLVRGTVTTALNFVKSTTNWLGDGTITPSTDVILASQLVSYRNSVMARINRGEVVSDLERVGAYTAGNMVSNLSMILNVQPTDEVRVIAQQAPIAFVQLFMTEALRNRKYDENGKLIDKGLSTYSFGVQSAPTLGGNISFSLPIAIDWEANNAFGIGIRYYSEPNNINQFLSVLGGISGTALLFGVSAISVLRTLGRASSFWAGEATEDVKGLVNLAKTTVKTVDNLMNGLISLAEGSINFFKTVYKYQRHLIKELVGGAKPASNSMRLAKLMHVGIVGWTAYQAGAFISDIFTDNPDTKFNSGLAVAAAASTYTFLYPTVDPVVKKVITNSINTFKPLTSPAFNLINKVPVLTRDKGISMSIYAASTILASYLMTSNSFGYIHGMETDEDGNKTFSSALTHVATIGMYAGLISLVGYNFADIGRTELDTLKQYNNYKRLANNSLMKDLRSFQNDLFRSYLLKRSDRAIINLSLQKDNLKTFRTSQENLDSLIRDLDELGNIKVSNTQDLILDPSNFRVYESIFSNPEFKFQLKERGIIKGGFTKKLAQLSVGMFLVTQLTRGLARTVSSLVNGGYSEEDIPSLVSSMEGTKSYTEPLVNLFKLVTGWDKLINTSVTIGDFEQLRGEKGETLLKRGKDIIDVTDHNNIKFTENLFGIFAPLVINPMNAYQSVLPIAGLTFRKGEYGTRVTSFLQVQTAGQDISVSTYKMASSFFYKYAYSNKTVLKILLDNGIRDISRGQESSLLSEGQSRNIAFLILTATAKLDPLSPGRSRKYSAAQTEFAVDLLTSDPITSLVLSERSRRFRELSYQPNLSIVSRMLDPFSPSSISAKTDQFTKGNPLNLSGMDRDLMKGVNLFNYTQYQFGQLGSLSLEHFKIHYDSAKDTIVRNKQAHEDTSEMISSSSLDMTPGPKSNLFSFTNMMRNLDAFVSTLLPIPVMRLGVYLAIFSYLSFQTAAYVGVKLFHNEYDVLEKTVGKMNTLITSIDRPDVSDTYHSKFFVETRVTPRAGIQTNELIIKRGSRIFKITPPPGASDLNFDIDSFKQGLTNVTINISNSTKTLFNKIEEVSQLVDVDYLNSGVRTKEDLINLLRPSYEKAVESYVDRVIDSFGTQVELRSPGGTRTVSVSIGESVSRILTPDGMELEKARLKEELMNYIDRRLDLDLSGDPSKGLFKGRSIQGMATYLSNSIKGSLVTYIQRISTTLYYLEPESTQWASRISADRVRQYVQRRGLPSRPSSSPLYQVEDLSGDIDEAITARANAIDTPSVRGRLTNMELLGRSLQAFGSLQAGLESVDLLSAFSQLAASSSNQNMNLGVQRDFVGSTVINSLFGAAATATIINVGKSADKFFSKGKVGVAIWVGLILALSAAMFGKYIYNSANEFIRSDIVQEGFRGLRTGYENLSRAIGSGIIGASSFIEDVTLGLIPEEAVISSIGFGASAFALVAGMGGKIRTAASISAKAMGISGLINSIPFVGEYFRKGTSAALSSITIPIGSHPVGMWFMGDVTSVPYWTINSFVDPNGSPIQTGTAPDIMRMQFQASFEASKDWTGSQTKSLFINPTMYGSRYYPESSDRIIGSRPAPVMDPFIDRELSIRAQYYNKFVVGNYIWNEAIRDGSNSRKLRRYNKSKLETTPAQSMEESSVEGAIEKDIKAIKDNIAKALANETMATLSAPIIQHFVNLKTNTLEKLNGTVVVLKEKVGSPLIETFQNIAYHRYRKTPVVHTEVLALKEDDQIEIVKGPSSANDISAYSMSTFNITPHSISFTI